MHQFKAFAQKVQGKSISASTSGYCQARKRLPNNILNNVLGHTKKRGFTLHPLVKRRVVCADGTRLLAADTEANQAKWPQQANQKAGCAFPQIRLLIMDSETDYERQEKSFKSSVQLLLAYSDNAIEVKDKWSKKCLNELLQNVNC